MRSPILVSAASSEHLALRPELPSDFFRISKIYYASKHRRRDGYNDGVLNRHWLFLVSLLQPLTATGRVTASKFQ